MKINNSLLKWIAIISMITDHLAVMITEHIPMQVYYVMRGVGRLAFPIFCFLLVEGFINTKSFGKYFIRVVVFAVLSQIPYNILRYGNIIGGGYFNILFTFSVTLVVLYILARCKMNRIKGFLVAFITIVASMTVTYLLNFEYSYKCILLAVLFYYTGRNISYQAVKNVGAVAILYLNCGMVDLAAPLSLFFINAYNGEKGKFPKWFGYVFYPLHLLLFGLVRILIS